MKTYKKRLKLKENIKIGLVWISCAIVLITTLIWYSDYRLPNLENNDQEKKVKVVEVNLKK